MNRMGKPKLITGLFKNRLAAEAAVDAIMKRGYTRDDISVLMSDATRSKEFALQARTHAADGAGVGGAVGGVVGAVLAAIVAVGSTIILPGQNDGAADCHDRRQHRSHNSTNCTPNSSAVSRVSARLQREFFASRSVRH